MPDPTHSLILAFDFGLRRIGIAAGNTLTGTSAPRRTVGNGHGGPDWPAIDRELKEIGPSMLLVGAPYNDDGSPGSVAPAATRFAAELHARYGLPVERIDESYSSVEASAGLKAGRAAGTRGRIRRGDIDSAAAAVLLDSYLRNRGAEQRRMTEQRRADGSLRHLLTLETLTRSELEALLERSQHYVRALGQPAPREAALAGITVANLFTEPSTRTRVSFELAAKRLGAEVVNLEVQLSSRVKGESMLDTVFTLEALHVDVFVIRDAEAGVPALVADHVDPHVSVLSAGEAHLSHPTQGLLDALTVLQHKKRLDGLAVAIVGDIRHSRVARSAAQVMLALGVGELRIVAPPALMPATQEFTGCARYTRLEEGLAGADVVMMLRIQRERFADAEVPAGDDYFRLYGLTAERLALARPDAIVMHPQPMNRGVEIASDVADGRQSVIRQQVSNGVAVRMAVLETIVSGRR